LNLTHDGKEPVAVAQVTSPEKKEILRAGTDKTPPKEISSDGHDETAMLGVSDWVHELTGVKPIILSRQITRGQTLIEKFESYSKDAACAIVLMTPDDEARAKRAPKDVEGRARQNVVFELGYSYGTLDRGNVTVLNFGVELPWDINGLVYIGEDSWKLDLGRELGGSGILHTSDRRELRCRQPRASAVKGPFPDCSMRQIAM
jgi:predicted nucleotide-binding protein